MWLSAPLLVGVVVLCDLSAAHMNQPQFVNVAPPQHQQAQQYQQHPQGGVPQVGHVPQGGNMLRDKNNIQDRAHIQEHLQEILGDGQDLSKMSEEELQFHYFKLHDNDDNNRLDGLELVKSLIHWHVEEHKHMQNAQGVPIQQNTGHATTKIFSDQELAAMIDPILQMDDANHDGFIDYPEFVAAQKQRGF